MKNILIIALLMLSSMNLRAQGQLSGGKHYAQPDLAKFEGKWHYTDGTTNFTLILRKEKVKVKSGTDDFSLDAIQGDYTLAKDEKIINASAKPNPAITSGGFYDATKNKNVLRFIFTDLGKESKRCQVIFELIKGDPEKAKWTLTNTEHIVVGDTHYDPTFSVPEKMVLTKL